MKYRYQVLQGRERLRHTRNALGAHIGRGELARAHGPNYPAGPVVVGRHATHQGTLVVVRSDGAPQIAQALLGQAILGTRKYSITSGNVTDDIIKKHLKLHATQ